MEEKMGRPKSRLVKLLGLGFYARSIASEMQVLLGFTRFHVQ